MARSRSYPRPKSAGGVARPAPYQSRSPEPTRLGTGNTGSDLIKGASSFGGCLARSHRAKPYPKLFLDRGLVANVSRESATAGFGGERSTSIRQSAPAHASERIVCILSELRSILGSGHRQLRSTL